MEYIKGMKEVEAAKVPSRQEADKILEKVEPVSRGCNQSPVEAKVDGAG